MKTVRTRGAELSSETIDFIETHRIAEYGVNTKDFRRNERSSIFFFVEEANAILSFGMLKPVTLRFQEAEHDILGIGAIMAVEKGRGFGRTLMEEIATYLRESGKTGVGFCTAKTACGFYRKCGYEVAEGISHRFVYRPTDRVGPAEHLSDDTGVLYLEAEGSSLMSRILGAHDVVTLAVPFW